MKKAFYFLAAVVLIGLVAACNDKKPKQNNISINVENFDAADSTVYGFCGDGTSMHSLELVTDKGDTVYLAVNTDTVSNVRGGMSVGDRMAVTVMEEQEDGEVYKSAGIVINLTTLMGKWTALDKSFELQEGGEVTGDTSEPKPYREWKIYNGQLVLSADTFDIFELGADSLLLESKQGIFAYKRVTK